MRRFIDRFGAWLFGVAHPETHGSPPPPDRGVLHLLQHENAVLTRALANAQQRTGACVRQLHAQLRAQQARQMRLHAALVIKQTELMLLREDVAALLDASEAAADLVICQTGCTGHGHPWLEDDGQCRRTGKACVVPEPLARRLVLQR